MGWQPIETAPKDGRDILVMIPEDSALVPDIAYWDSDKYASNPRPLWSMRKKWLWGVRWCREHQPTHWQPLPEPPQEGE